MTTIAALIFGEDLETPFPYTFPRIFFGVTERIRVTRLDIWRESLGGVGRFAVALDNQDDIYGGAFSPQADGELKINGVSMMKGYLDDILPQVDDPAAVCHNLIKVIGRDYGQDLVNLFHTKKYLDQIIANIFGDAIAATGAELTLNATQTPSVTYEFKRTYLLDGFCELAKLVDADFYVQDDKVLQLFLLSSAPNSGVTLKSVPGDPTNNILSLDQIGEKIGIDIKNYIHIEAGDVDDHWTEGNANDFSGEHCAAISNDDSVFLAGKMSIRGTVASGMSPGEYLRIYLPFPNYSYDTLDFSGIAQADCSALLRHNTGYARRIEVYAMDDGGNEIQFQESWDNLAPNKWHKIDFQMGNEVEITDDPVHVLGWYYVTGSTFSWKLTRIGIRGGGSANAGDYDWLDGLNLGGITATAIADEGEPYGNHRKRMIPITRTDIKSQLQLDALAASELAKRKDPSQKLKVTATFQSACKYAGQTVIVNAPSSGINSVTYRILGLHHVAAPYEDLLRGFDAITEFDLVKYETTGVDPLRLRLINNPAWVNTQRLEARLRALERG